jgi:alpha-glucosidase
MSQLWLEDEHPYLIADGIARFRDPADVHQLAAPSLAVTASIRPIAPLPITFRARPVFSTTKVAAGASGAEGGGVGGGGGGRRVIRLATTPDTSLYGTGEIAGPLLRNGARTICWNTDSFEYSDANQSLYQSHPWVLAVRPDGSSFGVLADTTCKCEIDLSTDIRFSVDADRGAAPPFAIYVIERDTPQQVVAALADLTGECPIPPKWALGYQQSRWSYEPDTRVLEVADEFRNRRIPCDCLWLDIDYMDGFRCFTFDKTKFPDPAWLNAELHNRGFKTVYMIDPGIKVDPDYFVYQQGQAGGHFLLDSRGEEYHGKVWPGECAFPDFTRTETRHWWAGLYKDFLGSGGAGIDGVWNDMNEPAVFDNEDKQMPEDNLHRADDRLGGVGPHSRYHNVYGMLMVRASRRGILKARPDKRPFLLTRSNFIGGHRYAATWTGDNKSTWEHLAWSIPMILNLGLSGQPFAGPDIGGFAGEADAKLFARWMGIGALLPFARAHSIQNSKPHEPWAFGEQCEATCRRALERRYRLLPYIYTLFREASKTDIPIARPVFFADPADPKLRAIDDCFLLGPDILVRCQVKEDEPCTSPMPGGFWRPFEILDTSTPATSSPASGPLPTAHSPLPSPDPDLPQLLFRGGSIVPLGPVVQHVDEKPLDPLTLVVSMSGRGEARGQLYEDAGDGFAHEEGMFRLTTYHAFTEEDHITIQPQRPFGRMHAVDRELEVIVLLDRGRVLRAKGRDGKVIRVSLR